MDKNHFEIIVCARGWAHDSWRGTFYPDDLPEDWQLAYYSNEFGAVVVPASVWADLDTVEIERWVEDVPEEFLFYLEVDDPLTDWMKVTDIVKPLGGQLGGFLLRPMDVSPDLAIISSNITGASQIAPVSVLLPDSGVPNDEGKKLLKQYEVKCSWNVGEGEPDWMDSDYDSPLAVVCVGGNKNFTARQWRETIETSIDNTGENNQTLLMILYSEDPKISDLRTAMMIGELLSMPT